MLPRPAISHRGEAAYGQRFPTPACTGRCIPGTADITTPWRRTCAECRQRLETRDCVATGKISVSALSRGSSRFREWGGQSSIGGECEGTNCLARTSVPQCLRGGFALETTQRSSPSGCLSSCTSDSFKGLRLCQTRRATAIPKPKKMLITNRAATAAMPATNWSEIMATLSTTF